MLLDLNRRVGTTTVPLIAPLRALGASVVILTGETDRLRLTDQQVAAAGTLVAGEGRTLQLDLTLDEDVDDRDASRFHQMSVTVMLSNEGGSGGSTAAAS